MKYSLKDFPQASYTFDPTNKQISLIGLNFQLDLANVWAIQNATTNTVIMEVDMVSKCVDSIDANNVLTLAFDTSLMDS